MVISSVFHTFWDKRKVFALLNRTFNECFDELL